MTNKQRNILYTKLWKEQIDKYGFADVQDCFAIEQQIKEIEKNLNDKNKISNIKNRTKRN